MKPLMTVLACTLFAWVAAPGRAQAADPNTSVTLQVQVSLPKSHRPNPDPRFVAAFVSRLRSAFESQGYAGTITEAAGRETPNETAVLLNIAVTSLESRDGKVDVAFTAGVRTHADRLELGRYKDKGLHWNRDADQLGTGDQPGKTGSDATMLRLYHDLSASGLVPGLARG